MAPYLYSKRVTAKVYHDLAHLTERCNTDAILKRSKSDTRPEHLRPCRYCAMQHVPA